MDINLNYITIAALSGSFTLVRALPQYSPSQSYVQVFIAIYLGLLLPVFVWKVVICPKLLSPFRHLPRPPGGSFLNGHYWRMMKDVSGRPAEEWINTVPNDGLIYYNFILNAQRILVTKPQPLMEILTSNSYDYIKPPFTREALIRVLGLGLVLAEGNEHKHQRKHLAPAFSFRHVKDLSPIFRKKAKELVEALLATFNQQSKSHSIESSDATVLELQTWFSRAALDIIGVAGMGQDFGALQDADGGLSKSYQNMLAETKSRFILQTISVILPQWIVRRIPVAHNRNLAEGSQKIMAVARQLIRDRMQKLKDGEKRSGIDIISVAMDSGIFTDEELANQAMTFLTAGHETSGTSLTCAALELCRHPEMQTRIRDEIRLHLPSIDDVSSVGADALDRCMFFTAFCNELLRLHPPVTMTVRQSIRDTTVAGQFLPAKTTIVIPISAINKSVELWGPDATEFNPERWMKLAKSEAGVSASNFRYMTFLQGTRSCIGSLFAKMEMLWVLAAFIRSFEIELADKDAPIEFRSGITVKPDKLKVRLRRVEG